MNTPDPELKEEVAAILKSLVEITRDGEEGFKQAAENARSAKLKQVFTNYSHQRRQFVNELQNLERRFGETQVDEDGSAAGSLHRAWIGLRTALSSQNDQAILEEAERGEDAAIAAFQKAQENHHGLPVEVRSTIGSLAVQVRQAHDEVRKLRDSGLFTTKPAS